MKILITGGAGSVGRELTQRLVEAGQHVRVFDLPVCDFSALEALPRTEIIKGDIGDPATVLRAVESVDAVLHLAALLPLASERSREKTFAVNVTGTQRLVDAIRATGNKARLVFSSTVATYGSTMDEEPPLPVDHVQNPVDIYGESKIAAERVIMESGIPYTILRITAISIPALLDPPEIYPFMHDQRVELVNRADVAFALQAAVLQKTAQNHVYNISGGPTWQMRGHEYVEAVFRVMDIPIEDAVYRQTPWWSDWYDTAEAEAALHYQRTTFDEFLAQLDAAIREALGL
jgi:nucleoside-diphosphate-sugar epimerase